MLDYFGVKSEDTPLLAVAWVPEGGAPRKFVMPKAPLTREAIWAGLARAAGYSGSASGGAGAGAGGAQPLPAPTRGGVSATDLDELE